MRRLYAFHHHYRCSNKRQSLLTTTSKDVFHCRRNSSLDHQHSFSTTTKRNLVNINSIIYSDQPQESSSSTPPPPSTPPSSSSHDPHQSILNHEQHYARQQESIKATNNQQQQQQSNSEFNEETTTSQEHDEDGKEEEEEANRKLKRIALYWVYPIAIIIASYSMYSDDSLARMFRTLYHTLHLTYLYRKHHHKMKNTIMTDKSEEEEADEEHEFHMYCAQYMLKNIILVNGGIFIKMGQTIASLHHIVPPEYIHVFSTCFSSSPTTSSNTSSNTNTDNHHNNKKNESLRLIHQDYQTISQVFHEEFGQYPHQVFDAFDPIPFACASMAQVHLARLKNTGEQVAVKIQYQGLKERLNGDFYYLGLLKRLLPSSSDDKNTNTVGWLLDDFYHNTLVELDFEQEARNCDLFRQLFHESSHGRVTSPLIHWPYTSKRVITMEYIDGVSFQSLQHHTTTTTSTTNQNKKTAAATKKKMNRSQHNNKKNNAVRNELYQLLCDTYGKQLFVHGVVHMDPHQGNILVRRQSSSSSSAPMQLVFLDHGLYRRLDPVLRLHYCKLYESLVLSSSSSSHKHEGHHASHDPYATVEQFMDRYVKKDNRPKSPSSSLSHTSSLPMMSNTSQKQLFASMILGIPYHEHDIGLYSSLYNAMKMNTASSTSSHKTKHIHHEAQRPNETQQYVLDHWREMIHILSKLPSDVLLLMKTSELLFNLFSQLQPQSAHSSENVSNVSYMSSFAKYARQALNEHYSLVFQNELKAELFPERRHKRNPSSLYADEYDEGDKNQMQNQLSSWFSTNYWTYLLKSACKNVELKVQYYRICLTLYWAYVRFAVHINRSP